MSPAATATRSEPPADPSSNEPSHGVTGGSATTNGTRHADPPRARGPRRDGLALLLAEVALLGVHLAVAYGFARLYTDLGFLGDLVAFTVIAQGLAVAVRRLWPSGWVALAVSVVGAALVATWLLFPDTTSAGLPTRTTWDTAGDALWESRDLFREIAAPAPVLPGFQLAAGVAIWASVWFADWAAFRLRATAEALAAPTVLFVFAALLGSGDHRFTAALTFTAALLSFVAAHRAFLTQYDQAWLASSPESGPRATLRAGAALAVVALVGGLVLAPRLPGSDADAVLDWRTDAADGSSRTTISPIVDLRKRLVNQSDTEVFRVRANRPAYWRLTALDRFDGKLWSSGGEFSPGEGNLPHPEPPRPAAEVIQRVEITALSAIWVPAAFSATAVTQSSTPLRWDPESATLIVDASADTSDGLEYAVVSEVPESDPGMLRRVGTSDAAALEERYEGLPDDFPEVARTTARDVVAGAPSRYDQAIALQDWFRQEFTYSLDVPAGHGDDAVVSFLESRQGYCEQFAGTYAAMARSLGMPARVAIGFTPGNVVEDDGEGPLSTYQVLGRHAHAWPEVWFPSVGWVPFEPTPGRGMPGAEHTGVAPAQDDTAPTTVPGETTVPGDLGSTPSSTLPGDMPDQGVDVDLEGATASDGGDSSRTLLGVLALAAALVAALVLTPWVRAIVHRRRHHGSPAALVLDAWAEAQAPLRWLTGARARAEETHLEQAERLAPDLGADLRAEVRELARLTTSAAWSPDGATADDARRAEEITHHVREQARKRQPLLARVRRRLSWREAFDVPRPAPDHR